MGKDSICRLYIGHIPTEASEKDLINYFGTAGINRAAINVVLKYGYGFMECKDQAIADLAIERLNGRSFQGYALVVEPANPPHPNRSHGDGGNGGAQIRRRTLNGRSRSAIPTASTALDALFHRCMDVRDYPETTFLYVPKFVVGAIIGTKGAIIRHLIWASGASIKIATADESESQTERRVSIHGNIDTHWKAQSLLFEKVIEAYEPYTPNMRLRMEMFVPNECVGRLIGKGGLRIQEIQVATGARFKFLTADEASGRAVDGKTVLQIYGDYPTLYHAQARIRLGIGNILHELGKQSQEEKDQSKGQDEGTLSEQMSQLQI